MVPVLDHAAAATGPARPGSAGGAGAQQGRREVQRERHLAHRRRPREEHGVRDVRGQHRADGRDRGRLADGQEAVHGDGSRIARGGSALGRLTPSSCGASSGAWGLGRGGRRGATSGPRPRTAGRRGGPALRRGGLGDRERRLGGRDRRLGDRLGGRRRAARGPALRGLGRGGRRGPATSWAAASATGRRVVRRFGAAASAIGVVRLGDRLGGRRRRGAWSGASGPRPGRGLAGPARGGRPAGSWPAARGGAPRAPAGPRSTARRCRRSAGPDRTRSGRSGRGCARRLLAAAAAAATAGAAARRRSCGAPGWSANRLTPAPRPPP